MCEVDMTNDIPDELKIAHEALSAVNYFHEDISMAEEMLKANDTMFVRRQYIRSLFAAYESSIWQYKQMCFKLNQSGVGVELSQVEILFLSDRKIKLDENGELKEVNLRVTLKENLSTTIEILDKFIGEKRFGELLNPKEDKSGWDAFIKAIKIRDKLMHPRQVEDFNISKLQLDQVKSSFKWFLTFVHSPVLCSFLDDCKEYQDIGN